MAHDSSTLLLPRQALSATPVIPTATATPRAVPLSGDSCRHRSSWDGCRSHCAASSRRCSSFGPCLSHTRRRSASPSSRRAPHSGKAARIDFALPAADVSASKSRGFAAVAADAVVAVREASAAAWQRGLVAYRKCANVVCDVHAGMMDTGRALAPVLQAAPRWAVTSCALCMLIAQLLIVGAFTAASVECTEVSVASKMGSDRMRLGALSLLMFLAGGLAAILRDHPLHGFIAILI